MVLLQIEELETYYFTPTGCIKAVCGVDLEVEKGEVLGIVGESGSGKTTLALSILKLIEPPGRIVRGKILFDDEDILPMDEDEMRLIRWKRISFIPQSAMNALNPVMRVRDQIAEAMVEHEQATKSEARRRTMKLLDLVGIDPKRADGYPYQFSGGMKQRVVIAMALACDPEIIIADEPTTGLDVVVQAQILGLLKDLCEKRGLSMIFISHDLSIVNEVCDKTAIMYAGKIVEHSDTRSLAERQFHPYSRGLMRSSLNLIGPRTRIESIPSSVPDLINPPFGCKFHTRCPHAFELCVEAEPKLREVSPGHLSACHLGGH